MSEHPITHADAVVVGAGPGGSAAARFLADAGRDVVVLEKASFPRDKVCGDALTPRAVRALEQLGLHEEAAGEPDGWVAQSGLRMYGGRTVLDLPWPEVGGWPTHSVTATRSLFDHTLAEHAVKGGAQLWERTEATAPVWLSDRQERVAGVTYRTRDREDGATEEGTVRAPLVILADGNSSRMAVALGLHRDASRPMGVAVRAYYESPRAEMDRMEGFLEMRTPPEEGARYEDGDLLPAYGWIFPLDDGVVNVGWGLLDSSPHFRSINYRKVLEAWVDQFPAEWGITPETRTGGVRSAGLPMAHNRHPMLHRGALLVGDSAGMVNPFNGEGISYAIEAAAFAAEVGDEAIARGSDAPLSRYPELVQGEWGGYYTLGRTFTWLMGHPTVMRVCRDYGMPRRRLMDFVFRTMAHLVSPRSRDATDLILNSLSRAVPAA
ncbi:geranylgeranyl reductase family protein [Egibacter rhizosphaerae]|uniref:Geranylgeranyl reductase family protein n=1 Tax=Egibacter rhizosphaerae TaxID=1670831 RepID=A0A411YGP7_9ACTN|nr:geranylgeranyl reductase family protein [Egibacter rhizosphaerae]QBI20357.1 geranylgeranyl reductase family protein [Egibacter rhizosphaerae]